MMTRKKRKDTETLTNLLAALEKFDQLKREKWEQIDEEVQASNLPGTPTEDWIIPPDEGITSDLLMKDKAYRKLRDEIESLKKEVIDIAAFLKIPVHPIEWLSFNNPLIGNEALEDAKESLRLVLGRQRNVLYFFENIKVLCSRAINRIK